MSTTYFKLEGGRELERALGELSKATAKAVVRRVLLDAAEPIRAQAEANAPVRSSGKKTFRLSKGGALLERRRGALKMHVGKGTRLSKNQARLNRKLGKSEVEVYVGTRDRIGRLVEFGTQGTRPQPFLRRAWLAEGGQRAVTRIGSGLGVEIDRAARRAARRTARLAAKG